MNSRNKGKVGEREFAALLRDNGFDARRGQQFAGSPESPDVVCPALDWLHIEVKRVEQLNLAEACAQASKDSGGKPWIVAHRRNRGPWFVTVEAEVLFEMLVQCLPFVDLWPFTEPRCVTLDAELFFQFLREVQRKRFTDDSGWVVPADEATSIHTPVLRHGGASRTGHKSISDSNNSSSEQQGQQQP
jgi:Holliday junction resolvase